MEAVTQEKVGTQSRIIYDWVSICFKKHSVAEVMSLLDLVVLNFQEVKGAHGYRDRMFREGVSIHYNGRDDMGVWLEMSGQGCRIFETYGSGDYEKLLSMCADANNGMHLTRLDVAFDDLDGILDIDTLCDDARNKNVVTRFHEDSWEVRFSGKGNSVNFGSKKSEIFVRIYDKDAEQGRVEGRHWVRVEIQFRRERALGFVKTAEKVPSIGERFRGVLSNYVRFVTPTDDSNKRRWPTAEYWDKLLCEAAAISIYEKPKTEYKLNQLEAYVVKQAGNAIDAYIQIRGVEGFMEAIKERGTTKNPKYDTLIEALRKPVKKRELTPDEIYANGLDFVFYKDFSSKEVIRDYYGYRWVKCEECGNILREDEVVMYGGENPNYGICRDCGKEGQA